MKQGATDHGEESRLVELDEDHGKATAFNMLFMLWRRRTLASAYEAGMQLVRKLSQQYPEGVGVLNVIEVDASPPDAATRKLFVEFLHLGPLKHFSVTYDATGFKAASIRAVVGGAQALARPSCKCSVHGALADAARWHATVQRSLNHHESNEQILGVAEGLRALHRQRFP